VTVETAGDSALLAFGVTAKVADQTAHGDGGLELRDGLGHFAAGARVWVLPPQWGDGGEKVLVAGRHRGSRGRGYARIVVPRRHLTGFRARGIYSPALLTALTRPLRDGGPRLRMWDTREEAEQTAGLWRDYPLEARAEGGFLWRPVTDPPPAELEDNGRTYHLAHFNAYRAIYSPHPPPPEQPQRTSDNQPPIWRSIGPISATDSC